MRNVVHHPSDDIKAYVIALIIIKLCLNRQSNEPILQPCINAAICKEVLNLTYITEVADNQSINIGFFPTTEIV